jgi:hypothetical protein
MVRMGQLGSRRYRRAGRNAMRPGRLIIRLIIQTIRRVPSGSVWIDDASNVSRPDRSGADQIDAEHQATHLALGAYALGRRPISRCATVAAPSSRLLFSHPMGPALNDLPGPLLLCELGWSNRINGCDSDPG